MLLRSLAKRTKQLLLLYSPPAQVPNVRAHPFLTCKLPVITGHGSLCICHTGSPQTSQQPLPSCRPRADGGSESTSTTHHTNIEPELFSDNKHVGESALFSNRGLEQPKTRRAYKWLAASHTLRREIVNWPHGVLETRSHLRA